MSQESEPLVSVVTPFYNTAEYLTECLESVIKQTYSNWEYVLLNNCSTDGSAEIARQYANRDPRIRLVDNVELLPQVENYNRALSLISPRSTYTKVVEADNWIHPECLRLMVEVAEAHPCVGIVSAYCSTERTLRFLGLPQRTTAISGRDAARLHFIHDAYLFGSPTTVLMRSEAVRAHQRFYDEGTWLAEDLSACYDLLQQWDFGFVHQVLTFVRTENEGSIQTERWGFDPMVLDRLAVLTRHGADFLDPIEYREALRQTTKTYYGRLALGILHRKGTGFWKFHRAGLGEFGSSMDYGRLALELVREIVWLAANPGQSCMALLRQLRLRAAPMQLRPRDAERPVGNSLLTPPTSHANGGSIPTN